MRHNFEQLRALLGAALLACLIAVPIPGWTADAGLNRLERSVKAAFVFKFVGYVEWPDASLPRPDTHIIIGVIGADDIAAELQQLASARSMAPMNRM